MPHLVFDDGANNRLRLIFGQSGRHQVGHNFTIDFCPVRHVSFSLLALLLGALELRFSLPALFSDGVLPCFTACHLCFETS